VSHRTVSVRLQTVLPPELEPPLKEVTDRLAAEEQSSASVQ
jgi:hypothetical protein